MSLRRETRVLSPGGALQMLPSSQLVMDIYDEQKVCPEASAGLLSSITFGWLNPLLNRGYKHALELKDLWQAAPEDRVENLHKTFSRHWREQQQRPQGVPPRLIRIATRVL